MISDLALLISLTFFLWETWWLLFGDNRNGKE